jgi:hypothetical protein
MAISYGLDDKSRYATLKFAAMNLVVSQNTLQFNEFDVAKVRCFARLLKPKSRHRPLCRTAT